MATSRQGTQDIVAEEELPAGRPLRAATPAFLDRNRGFVSSFAFFILMILVFIIANSRVFLNPATYTAVFVSLPIYTMLAVASVFVVVAGEIDLAFPSIVGVCAFVFAEVVNAGISPFIGFVLSVLIGLAVGLVNGMLVAYVGLSSLVATLGMQFLLRGMIQVLSGGNGITLSQLSSTFFYNLFVGSVGGLPVQMLWGIAFAALAVFLFNRHRFGARVRCVGDNLEAAREMGIDVRKVKVATFMFVGLASALAGVLAILINVSFWPTVGDGYLLIVLAAVFIGGTPTWGGVGTIAGAVCGAFTVGFIESGIVAAGLTGFYTQLFEGFVIILSLVAHRLNRPRYYRGV